MSASDATSLMLIDIQQRMTTITLSMVVLARFANDYPDTCLSFSFREVIGRGSRSNWSRSASIPRARRFDATCVYCCLPLPIFGLDSLSVGTAEL